MLGILGRPRQATFLLKRTTYFYIAIANILNIPLAVLFCHLWSQVWDAQQSKSIKKPPIAPANLLVVALELQAALATKCPSLASFHAQNRHATKQLWGILLHEFNSYEHSMPIFCPFSSQPGLLAALRCVFLVCVCVFKRECKVTSLVRKMLISIHSPGGAKGKTQIAAGSVLIHCTNSKKKCFFALYTLIFCPETFTSYRRLIIVHV